jgi:predicted PurR-regulated permease PerM
MRRDRPLPGGRLIGHHRSMKYERILLLAMAVALGIGCLLILLPFLPAMLWAGILVYCLWPLYLKLSRYIPSSIAAFLITLVLAAIILVPLVHLALVAAREARDNRAWVQDVMQNGLPPAPPMLARLPLIGGVLTDFWNNSADDLGGAASSLQPVLGPITHSGIHLLFRLTHGLIGIIVALFITYFFFLTGAEVVSRIRIFLVRLMDESTAEHLLMLIAGTVRGVVFGIVGTAALQGILYAIGFELLHAPKALLLASLAGLVSIVPAGAVIIYVPLSLYLLATGHPLHAVVLLIYCFGVVGGADSIVRPWLIARGAQLPYALTLLGVLGGAIAFGALGIFVGPVLLVLGLSVAEEFAGQARGAWRQP